MNQLDLVGQEILADAKALFARLDGLPDDDRLDVINELRAALHKHSPMKSEPVDCVLWVRADNVQGNAYNPNVVAPPEMTLLKKSVTADGFTQPIVVWPVDDWGPRDGTFEIVDGFHRNRVGRETPALRKRLLGRLPVTVIRPDRTSVDDRMAATVRHNRARGKHTVDGMAELILDLARRGKTDQWIASELGLDLDEVLRLRQVQGLAEMFADEEFSEAWEPTYDPEGGPLYEPENGGGSGPR